ncbi:MAG TPA: HAD-IA family hydrolase [Candidatus Saccharimonadia bacterium]|nr:HAD-IA family hydrolase [Candidatus Saccharimonadia bacterium]
MSQTIKALIFDCFGVFYVDPVFAYMRDPATTPAKAVTLHSLDEQAARGVLSKQDFVEQASVLLGITAEAAEQRFFQSKGRDERLVALVKQLRRHYKIGLLSNIGADMMGGFFSPAERADLFDAAILSGEVKMAKPDREIFELACQRLGVELSEAVMIDDMQSTCDMVRTYGMRSICYRDFAQLTEELRRMGILAKQNSSLKLNMNAATADDLAVIIWDYHHLHQPLEKCDAILALGSSDLRVGEYAAKLFLEGYADWLVVSGGLGKITKDRFNKPEAEVFADIAVRMGVPRDRIIIEPEATNTGQNITLTHKLLEGRGLRPASLIVVTKPYMERRTYATFQKQWPDTATKLIVSSPPIEYADYATEELPKELVINIMVGDLQRIKEYPKLGFQIEQDIPPNVWRAYEQLVAAGFDKALMKEAS